MSINLANGKYYGSGLGIAPNAELDSGNLEVVILANISILDYIRHLSQVRKCQLLDHPEVHYYSMPAIDIESTDGRPHPIDMDGEFIGFTPMKVKKLKQVLPFLCG